MAAFVVTLTATLALLAAGTELSGRLKAPDATVLAVLGAVVATLVVAAGVDTGLRYQGVHDLVFDALLPMLVFAAAYGLDPLQLRRRLRPITALAAFGVLATAVLATPILYYGIGHPTGFPWTAALLTGVLLAATDHTVVARPLEQAGARSIGDLLEGESLFSDVTSAVLVGVAWTLALGGGMAATPSGAALELARQLGGGVIAGAACGWLASHAVRRCAPLPAQWAVLAAAFASSLAAQAVGASGVAACFVAGLVLGRTRPRAAAELVDVLGRAAIGSLFLLAGATSTLAMFTERWFAMLIGIGAVLVARLCAVPLAFAAAGLTRRIPLEEQLLIGFLGTRGAVVLALALSIPIELPYWWTIQSIAYGVVAFDLFLIAPLAPMLVRRLNGNRGRAVHG